MITSLIVGAIAAFPLIVTGAGIVYGYLAEKTAQKEFRAIGCRIGVHSWIEVDGYDVQEDIISSWKACPHCGKVTRR